MSNDLEELNAFLGGAGTEATNAWLRGELSTPQSESRRLMESIRDRNRHALGEALQAHLERLTSQDVDVIESDADVRPDGEAADPSQAINGSESILRLPGAPPVIRPWLRSLTNVAAILLRVDMVPIAAAVAILVIVLAASLSNYGEKDDLAVVPNLEPGNIAPPPRSLLPKSKPSPPPVTPPPAPTEATSQPEAKEIPTSREEEPPAVETPDNPKPDPKLHTDLRSPLMKAGLAKPTLKNIMADPSAYLNEVVTPSDLLLVNGSMGLSVKTGSGNYQDLQQPGVPFQIVLNPGLAGHLREQLNRFAIVGGDYPAMMKLKVEMTPGNNGYRGVVEWLEFLCYIDARFAEQGNIAKSVIVLTMTPAGARFGYTPENKEWHTRLSSTHIFTKVKNDYKKENRPPIYAEWAHKAFQPDRSSAIFFHNWLKAHIPKIQ